MSDTPDVVTRVAGELSRVVEPLRAAASDEDARRDLFLATGRDVDALAAFPLAAFTREVLALVDRAEAIARAAAATDAARGGFDDLSARLRDVDAIFAAIRKLSQLASEPALTIPPATQAALATLGEDLAHVLIVDYLRRYQPMALKLAHLLTVVRLPGDRVSMGGAIIQTPRVEFSRLRDLLTDPVEALRDEYVGGRPLATPDDARDAAAVLFRRLAPLLTMWGAQVTPAGRTTGAAGEAARALAFAFLIPADAAMLALGAILKFVSDAEGGAGLVVTPIGQAQGTWVARQWQLIVSATAQPGAVLIRRTGPVLPKAIPAISVTVSAESRAEGDTPTVVIGPPGATRLELGHIGATARAALAPPRQEFDMTVAFDRCAIVIAAGDSDGFLQHILPKDGLNIGFDFGIGWSNTKGLYFRGSAGLEATLPINVSLLGILSLDSVYLALKADASNGVRGVVAATTTIELGPVTANVERFGLEALLTFPPDGGNLGVAEFVLRFKPPSGAALVIEAPGVKGGGYLFFDVDQQQYAGVLQLEIAEKIAVKAVGLLTTRMPDGSPGFSLLLIITAEGFSIQLGFGFTLTGIGGLLGVNRTAAADALRSAIRSGAVGSIMFPVDPVRNAQRIVSDVSTVFPVAPDRYVFGPMVQLAWGTPPIITLELGLVLEVPDPIRLIILGRGLMLLPDAKAPVAQIRFDAVGIVDFAKGDVSFDAILYDSRLLAFVLTGEMALRAHVGDQPSFLFAVGGWHPRFPAPAGFPALSRVALTLSTTENARLRLEAYLAVTSNTVQFGARADFFFGLGDFGVEGYLGFDTLFHFAPTFSFIADLGASVALRSGTAVIMTVTLTMTLSGPQPWHVWGLATFTILGVKQAVAFEARYGAEPPQPALPAPVDVQPLLTAALVDPRNWSGELPAGEGARVAFRSAPTSNTLRVHPLATVAVRERVVPLDMKLEAFGTAPITGATEFSVTAVRRGTSTAIPSQPIVDAFALAQFVHMSDDQKLAAPAFVDKPAGLRFSASGVAFAAEPALDAAVTYETVVIVPGPSAAQPGPAYTMSAASLDKTARLRVVPQ